MTTAAYDGKMIAADKQSTSGGMKHRVTKLFRIGNAAVAIAGQLDFGLEMVAWLRAGAEEKDFPAFQRTSDFVHLLQVNPDGSAFHFEQSPHPIRVESLHYAIGSGRQFAEAAMRLGCTAEQAVAVAAEMDIYTGMGVDVIHLADLAGGGSAE